MAIITLVTDFGSQDVYAGMMKGVILSFNPSVTIVDLTHDIDFGDIVQAAYLIQSSHAYFPSHTIHLVVVDPGVGSHRSIIAVHANDHYFVAPDNGVLGVMIGRSDIQALVRVENIKYFQNTVSPTFHGRDIFAPVAAHLSMGLNILELGPSIHPSDLAEIELDEPGITSNGILTGRIIAMDRYGNCVTNIHEKILEENFPGISPVNLMVELNGRLIHGLSRCYANVSPKAPLALVGSRRYLEISVNGEDAGKFFDVVKGDSIRVFVKQ